MRRGGAPREGGFTTIPTPTLTLTPHPDPSPQHPDPGWGREAAILRCGHRADLRVLKPRVVLRGELGIAFDALSLDFLGAR